MLGNLKWKVLTIVFVATLTTSTLWAQERRISVDFQDADISVVLRTFSEISGKNIIASKNVSGKVTVSLRNVPWRVAFSTILEMYGLTYTEEAGIIKVMTVDEAKTYRSAKMPVTKVFQIKYAKASELQASLTSLLTSTGKMVVDERTNSLVVTDVPDALREIENLINKLDTPTPQVLIQAKIVEIEYSAAKALGIDWSVVNPASPVSGVPFTVDIPLGTAFTGRVRFGKLVSGMSIDAIIDMLESESKANILSQPSIVALDNEEAEILSGKQIPIITRDIAGNQVIQFYNVALRLRVRPHIGPNGVILMELNPEISDIAGEAPGGAGVMIATQQARTKLSVRDGETIVIGGIIRTRKKYGESRVPFISRIPLIGVLFKSRSEDIEKVELMIFVTPKIISYASQ